MVSHEGISLALQEDSCGIQQEGLGLEIQGHKHVTSHPDCCTVYLDNDTTYKIRIYNTNRFSAMVTLTLDGVAIGTFFLQPLSKYDIERPVDRPLAFVFSYSSSCPAINSEDEISSSSDNIKYKAYKHLAESDIMNKFKSTLVATFQPEAGSKIFQADVHFPHIQSTHRVEIKVDMSLPDLYQVLAQAAGGWILDPKCVLMAWYNAEYDSPAHNALHINQHNMNLKSDDRKYLPPLLKMSLILIETLYINIQHTSTELCLSVDSCPTISHLLEHVTLSTGPWQSPLYMCSTGGRYLGSTKWIQGDIFVSELFTKHELNEMPTANSLAVVVREDRPPSVFNIVCRLSDDKKYFLEVDKDSTILQCRHQLECLGGPEIDRSMWIFGGDLLENSRTIHECRLGPNSCLDVILRKTKTLSSLEMKDPIAVDGHVSIDTAELIRKTDNKVIEKAKRRKHGKVKNHKLRRGGHRNTILGDRVDQQFIEVNAIEVDERFNTTLSITILPKEMESVDFSPSLPPESNHVNSKSVCTLL